MGVSLQRLTRIVVQFSPWRPDARSAREFLARVTSAPARATNPACKVETRLRVKGDAYVDVTYENARTERIPAAGLDAKALAARVQGLADEMETAERLKAVGGAGGALESRWGAAPGRERDVGAVRHVPRQT